MPEFENLTENKLETWAKSNPEKLRQAAHKVVDLMADHGNFQALVTDVVSNMGLCAEELACEQVGLPHDEIVDGTAAEESQDSEGEEELEPGFSLGKDGTLMVNESVFSPRLRAKMAAAVDGRSVTEAEMINAALDHLLNDLSEKERWAVIEAYRKKQGDDETAEADDDDDMGRPEEVEQNLMLPVRLLADVDRAIDELKEWSHGELSLDDVCAGGLVAFLAADRNTQIEWIAQARTCDLREFGASYAVTSQDDVADDPTEFDVLVRQYAGDDKNKLYELALYVVQESVNCGWERHVVDGVAKKTDLAGFVAETLRESGLSYLRQVIDEAEAKRTKENPEEEQPEPEAVAARG